MEYVRPLPGGTDEKYLSQGKLTLEPQTSQILLRCNFQIHDMYSRASLLANGVGGGGL
jgi:hypothetical protein